MSPEFPNGINSSLEQELFLQEKRYMDLLKADAEFYILKSVRMKINQLKAEIAGQQMHSSQQSGNQQQESSGYQY